MKDNESAQNIGLRHCLIVRCRPQFGSKGAMSLISSSPSVGWFRTWVSSSTSSRHSWVPRWLLLYCSITRICNYIENHLLMMILMQNSKYFNCDRREFKYPYTSQITPVFLFTNRNMNVTSVIESLSRLNEIMYVKGMESGFRHTHPAPLQALD